MRAILIVVAVLIILGAILLLLGTSLSPQKSPETTSSAGGGGSLSFTLKSVFANGERIPIKYTCDGEDISPPLSWEGQPEGVVSYVLIVEDPDAPIGTFTHWVMYNIPGKLTSLPEGVPKQKETELGMQGINDFRRVGYGGPCPPPGKPHRYFFKLYALESTLDLPPGARKRDVIEAMEGHVLAQSQIMGIYGRG
ncbi:MAG: YbhB/YbcL family Raf kinase inhibitor-like protein [Candidatus Korarchaeota archaeon]|nr:YbhB/YbcL family Raf kinase inhibitor-like protein [Candidatus Korarchaeota archaeon]